MQPQDLDSEAVSAEVNETVASPGSLLQTNPSHKSNIVVTPIDQNESTSTNTTNPYLALRLSNIARNEARLRELGLLQKSRRSPTQGVKRSRPTNSAASSSNHQPVRRSRRIRSSISYKEEDQGKNDKDKEKAFEEADDFIPSEEEDEDADRTGIDKTDPRPNHPQRTTTTTTAVAAVVNRPNKDSSKNQYSTTRHQQPQTKYPPKPPPVSLSPNSARNISIDVPRLVLDPEQGWLGKPMTATGKAIVMETAAQFFSSDTQQQQQRKISFNKYCGAQDWKQGIFLWVNLGGKNVAKKKNDFYEQGRKMTWYGGSRMKPESNMIQKLLQVGKAAERNSDIVLWCRRYETAKRTFGPYYCMGRLKYESHNPNVMPVTFVWRLLDYEALMARKNNQVVQEMIL